MQKLHNYIAKISNEFLTGSATEHTYRGHLKDLVEAIDANVIAINEPKRVKAGAPDYLIATKTDNIEIGHIEAKDIGKDLNHKDYNEQFTRYKNALENLIITDYMEFQFYKNAQLYTTIKIAKIQDGKITPLAENFAEFINLIKNFTSFVGQSITSSSKLACMMAHKAKLMADVMLKAIEIDIETDENTELYSQYKIFKQMLIHDMTPKDFADMYAQTITYGMFTARFHDSTLQTFSRQEAAELLPHSNPFLRKLFQQLAGYDLDIRISWIVDSLVKIFLATDVTKLLENFGSTTQRNDPIIHFYEEFLAEFDPKLRKSRGVWYTPEPVVKFIVRAVDEVLTSEFNLSKGLSDTSKITIKVDNPSKKGKIDKEVHKVQVLDPATGTGTFLAETIKFLYEKKQYLKWNSYVTEHLIPRLHGFEIVMASYAMAHLKLDLLLKLTGYEPTTTQRLKVFLTNSLEEHHDETGNLFASFLATESQEADRVKKETPVMVVMGNPPYSGVSSNNIEWINRKINDYKYIEGEYFNERKHWLNDDYVKFIRYGEHYIEKNGEGILAFINPHGFLDNATFRGMRYHLLKTFDKIYTIDLHGNGNKKEICPDGSADENVFDIKQGVSINIFVKTKTSKKKLADVYHYDLYGKRDFKYDFLSGSSIKTVEWKKLEVKEPNYFFVPKDFEEQDSYEKGFKIDELYSVFNTGIMTMADNFILSETKAQLKENINDFLINSDSEEILKNKYSLGKNYAKWIIDNKNKIKIRDENFFQIVHRPFSNKFTYFSDNLLWRSRKNTTLNYLNKENIGLITAKSNKSDRVDHFFISNLMSEAKTGESTTQSYNFPLYLYPDKNSLTTERTPNLNLEIVKEIEERLGLAFVNEKTDAKDSFAPIDILDYIYAVLHSPTYREKYKEFLKIDFPRVPYPKIETFWELVNLGSELRSYHLLENPKVYEIVIALNESENNTIERKITKKDVEIEGDFVKLWLNDEQYIDKIPLVAWEFYIGGYQSAQKWLKDRVGREMREEDYEHYNKIIVALTKTHEIMQRIDEVLLKNMSF